MEDNSGLKSLLRWPAVYRTFRRMTGSDRVNRTFVDEVLRPQAGDRIFDIGCGPADILEFLPENIFYHGCDYSERYVEKARARYSARGTFSCIDITNMPGGTLGHFDKCIAMGVFHHLDDDSLRRLLRAIVQLLKPNGTLITYDPCFTNPQHPFARFVHRMDRGQHVRFEDTYSALIREVYPDATFNIRTDLCSVPATVIFATAPRPESR